MSLFRYEADGWSHYSGGFRTWVKTVLWVGGSMLALMWYAASATYVHDHYFLGYHTERCDAQIQSSCEALVLNEENPDFVVAAAFWPASVPISFALRHPALFGLLIPVAGAGGLGLYGSYRGIGYLRDEKRRLRIEKQEETERKLREATEHLEKVAPEYAQSLLTS